jgi:xanthine phosphoribosyltransferase
MECEERQVVMEELQRRIRKQARNLGDGILDVGTFVNHQIDTSLMTACAYQLARLFRGRGVTKVMTAEISGIGPALMTAHFLTIPLIYARRDKSVTMPPQTYHTLAPSHTKGIVSTLMVSPKVLGPSDRILIIDDFLASGETIEALVRLVEQAGATLVGIGALIEKRFEGGRVKLTRLGVPIRSLVAITDMSNGQIIFGSPNG